MRDKPEGRSQVTEVLGVGHRAEELDSMASTSTSVKRPISGPSGFIRCLRVVTCCVLTIVRVVGEVPCSRSTAPVEISFCRA